MSPTGSAQAEKAIMTFHRDELFVFGFASKNRMLNCGSVCLKRGVIHNSVNDTVQFKFA